MAYWGGVAHMSTEQSGTAAQRRGILPFGSLALQNRKSFGTLFGTLLRGILVAGLLLKPAMATSHDEATVDQLKARLPAASVSDKVHLCIQIAEKQLTDAKTLYEAGDVEKAQPLLTDVVAFSELARDYSIQSNKHQKQTEISVRAMSRKLNDILHLVGHDDRPPLQDAILRLERVRDDLLMSMFPKGAK
jgi:hypothetical protein